MLERETDEQLIDRFYAGNLTINDLMEELFRRYHDHLYRFVRAKCGDDDLAEDLCQDVWIKVRHALDMKQFQANLSFLSWLFRIAGNCIIDHRRLKRIREKPGSLAAMVGEGPEAAQITPIERLDKAEALARLEAAIEALDTDDEREVVKLYYLEELTLEEIGTRLKRSTSWAHGKRESGIKKLEEALGDLAPDRLPAERQCLLCQKPFQSWGESNRQCPKCENNEKERRVRAGKAWQKEEPEDQERQQELENKSYRLAQKAIPEDLWPIFRGLHGQGYTVESLAPKLQTSPEKVVAAYDQSLEAMRGYSQSHAISIPDLLLLPIRRCENPDCLERFIFRDFQVRLCAACRSPSP